jgi:hypothetical protein
MTIKEILDQYGQEKIDEICEKKQRQGLPQGGKPTRIQSFNSATPKNKK